MGIKGFEIKPMQQPMGHRIHELFYLSTLASKGTCTYPIRIPYVLGA